MIVRTIAKNEHKGIIECAAGTFPCALGRTGRAAIKREGDGATPIGTWPLLAVHYRADRVARPQTTLPISAIKESDGWCDAPADRNYNKLVRLPYAASAEQLWRADHLYDLVVTLDYNISSRSRAKGSAIFMHLAQPDFAPTEGCIALRQNHLRAILKTAEKGTSVIIPSG